MPRSATLEERLRAVRSNRRASQFSNAKTWAAWIVGLAAILVIVGGGVMSLR